MTKEKLWNMLALIVTGNKFNQYCGSPNIKISNGRMSSRAAVMYLYRKGHHCWSEEAAYKMAKSL